MNEICKIITLTNIWRLGKNNFSRLVPRRMDDAEMLSDDVPDLLAGSDRETRDGRQKAANN